MNEEQARQILGDTIQPDNRLYSLGHYIYWDKEDSKVCLDGNFNAKKLEAIAWWMKNKGAKPPEAKD